MDILWNASDKLAIAVSGGVDSMVLLDKVRRTKHFKDIYVLHVNHQLRDASKQEADMIEMYCEKYHLHFIAHTISKDFFDLTKSIQNDAREARYLFFEQAIHQYNIDYLLTAHHKDDQIETIFFRLMTHRYLYQPIDIQSMIERDGYKVIRPLLSESKDELYAYAERFDVPYMTDASNESNKYVRNYIRNEIMPSLEQAALNPDHLLYLAEYMKDTDALILKRVEVFQKQIKSNCLSRSQLVQENRLVIHRVLIQFIQQYHKDFALSHGLLDEIVRVMQTDTTHASFEIAQHWHIQIAYDKLIVRNKNEPVDEWMEITSPGKYHFNEYKIEIKSILSTIVIRKRVEGDLIEIGGKHQKVSRIMKDLKIPVHERSKVPIICVDNKVIAVGHYKQNHHLFNKDIIITKEK
ncbi:tRNA lysidine(34) synthetase TilS [Macrococcus capreoli]|uniref:tRNA lysidine(34) synthetase TilS n=1 Tax=Macrococcus capreoli TaxID=2982690 RepID=UPI0021D60F78|nr:tRNA lysidine(34) synthetase TilS [Macrococcus sp. TMW 2.2395]MCU7558383.1 tRNA lysidine(34) synthetase TilS [Macrococcus sp. TMW 2.2395]